MVRRRARLGRQFQISEFQISNGQRRQKQEASEDPSTALGMTTFRDEGEKSHWKFEMKIEAKEPAGRRRYGRAVSVSTSAGSWSCFLTGESKSAGKSACATEAKNGAGRVSLRLC